jgi:hypothetical protein
LVGDALLLPLTRCRLVQRLRWHSSFPSLRFSRRISAVCTGLSSSALQKARAQNCATSRSERRKRRLGSHARRAACTTSIGHPAQTCERGDAARPASHGQKPALAESTEKADRGFAAEQNFPHPLYPASSPVSFEMNIGKVPQVFGTRNPCSITVH